MTKRWINVCLSIEDMSMTRFLLCQTFKVQRPSWQLWVNVIHLSTLRWREPTTRDDNVIAPSEVVRITSYFCQVWIETVAGALPMNALSSSMMPRDKLNTILAALRWDFFSVNVEGLHLGSRPRRPIHVELVVIICYPSTSPISELSLLTKLILGFSFVILNVYN